jgi:hypothetical protein
METILTSRRSDYIWTTRRSVPENGNIHNHRSENYNYCKLHSSPLLVLTSNQFDLHYSITFPFSPFIYMCIYIYIYIYIYETNSLAFGKQVNYTDRATAAAGEVSTNLCDRYIYIYICKTKWISVRKGIIPTKGLQLVGEGSANFCV